MKRYPPMLLLMFVSGCASFFQERVSKYDESNQRLEEERVELLVRAEGLRRDVAAAGGALKPTVDIQREIESVQRSIERTEKLIDAEKREREGSLIGATEEVKYKQEILAAILGIGAAGISALVGSAKRMS